jgi:hypothetical protein
MAEIVTTLGYDPAIRQGAKRMDESKDNLRPPEPAPEAPEKKKRNRYVVPTLTIYGNLQQMTGTISATPGTADGGSGMKYKYTAP